jgi:hypothetical protein
MLGSSGLHRGDVSVVSPLRVAGQGSDPIVQSFPAWRRSGKK